MHVSHLRPLPLPVTTPVQSRAEHTKGPVNDPDKVPPVNRRFEDDERQAQQRRRPRWLDDPAAGTETEGDEAASAEEPHTAPTVIATPALQSAQPIADLLAGVTGEAAPAQPAELSSDGKPSLDDLLTLMRTGPK